MDRILRVNLSTGSITVEPVPDDHRHLGGRALTSRIVAEEVDPVCDPLGPSNKLVWAPGVISGTSASSSSRISVGCKSPLTGGIKESNGGGETGSLLAQAGYRAVIVEGAMQPGQWQVLVVDNEGARLEQPPEGAVGSGSAFTSAKILFEQYGRSCALAICGPAGEKQMMIAGIGNTDREGRPSRLCARGGVGAVMGSKGLKALVVMGNHKNQVVAADPEVWKQNVRTYHKSLRENPTTGQRYPDFGTSGTLDVVNRLGGLPTRNFAGGSFENAEKIGGIRMREIILERGGEGTPTHACMLGCAIRCSNVYPDADGKEIASSMEFETNGLMGANLAIDDFDSVARLTFLCNDLGADTIETGAALGVAMEAGLLSWGDGPAAERMLDEEVRSGTPMGRIIGSGAGLAGRTLGIRRVPVVKGQALSAYDPRAIKGNGVTYCTSPMGGDHTAGNTIAAKTDHLDPSDKVRISRDIQIQVAVIDSLGLCAFARGLVVADPGNFATLFNARTGLSWTWDDLYQWGLGVLKQELDFNRRAGLGKETDRLPEWMRNEPLPPHNAVFDVSEAEMDAIWEDATPAK